MGRRNNHEDIEITKEIYSVLWKILENDGV